MKLISVKIFLICLLFVFSACSSTQKADSQNATENKTVNLSESRAKIDNPSSYAEEKFAEKWKSEYEETIAELELNRRLWKESQILNYDFVIQRCCGGATDYWSPMLIKVRNGELDSMELVTKSGFVNYLKIDSYENFDTIDKLFNYLRHELEEGRIIESSFDKQYGHPTDARIIFAIGVTHGSNNIQISKFEIIK